MGSGNNIKAYLDGKLLFDVTDPSPLKPATRESLYYAVSKDTTSGDIIMKVVNPNNEDGNIVIKINGKHKILGGTVSVLISNSIADENSFTNPTKVVPDDSKIVGSLASKHFNYTFPKNSIVILRLKAHRHYKNE